MRIALISDIHGNYTALEAVLADIRQQPVDALICLGDIATIGPQPKPVLDSLKASGCACILGNHDAALFQLDAALEHQIAPPLIQTLHWCARQLTAEDFAYLYACRPVIELPLGADAALLCYHGSPQSNTDVILATTPAEELDRLLTGRVATVMAGGHSHIQMLRQHNGMLVMNPGSVGNAFLKPPLPGATPTLLPWAEYALVNWVEGLLSIDLRRVPFDIGAYIEVISQSDIPIRDWWLQQYSSPASDSGSGNGSV
ncbi:MAG TPA: metallophosphoesterase family protein [Anaerolineales bacterium]|nr:metallophosphoesterase family protein [Anaerolineales bacterium]